MSNIQNKVDAILKSMNYKGIPFKVKVFEGTTYLYKESASESEQVFLKDKLDEKVLALILGTNKIKKYFICEGEVVTEDLEEVLKDFRDARNGDDCFVEYLNTLDGEIIYQPYGYFSLGDESYFVFDADKKNKYCGEKFEVTINNTLYYIYKVIENAD